VSHGHDDYAVEPIRGLPENLPEGEHILWQGAPAFWQLAKEVFHIRAVAMYFAALMIWRGGVNWSAHHNWVFGIGAALSVLPMALIGLGLLALLAYLSARTSVYTITNRRVVMRVGVALPTAINIPFGLIGAADLNVHGNGAGDIALAVTDETRMAWSNLWPHVRPWKLAKPEPMFRALPDVRAVATLLGNALAQAHPAGTVRQPESAVARTVKMPVYAAVQDEAPPAGLHA
jgi:hypothetical protein